MKALAILVVLTLVASPAQAQQRLDMPELGVSIEVPAAWQQTKTWNLTDDLPAFGLYHVMNVESGQSVAVHQEECSTPERRGAWVKGRLAEKRARDGDTIKPLSREGAVRFGEHRGFEATEPRGEFTFKAYVFYLAKGERCYEVKLVSPEGDFARSGPVFQQLVNSITFAM